MPIPSPKKNERTDEFLPRCMKAISGEYPRQQAYQICQEKLTNRNMSKQTKDIFILKPKKSENRGKYLQRCSAHPKMKEQFGSMKERMAHCLNAFNSYYSYWNKLEKFSEDSFEARFEGCMSEQKAKGSDYKESYQYCSMKMEDLIVEPVAMENMESNLESCIKRRMEQEGISHDQARKECSASVVVSPAGGTNPSVAPQGSTSVSLAEDCPEAILDIKKNLSNRQVAIDTAHYGPLDPNLPNEDYWTAKAKQFNTSVEEAKKALCANCGFFNQTKSILDCIAKGIGEGKGEPDPYDTIEAGDVGYCEAFDFKCAGKRTCDAWLAGGPIKD